jgi:hypothetical protein
MAIDLILYYTAIKYHFAYEGVRELHKLWHDFCKNCPVDARLLTICHSRGVVYVRNALMSFPEDLRKHIDVIPIAPGGFIRPELCKRVRHFESDADPIPLADMLGRERCKNTITTLERHYEANPFFDHDFTSETFRETLRIEINTMQSEIDEIESFN